MRVWAGGRHLHYGAALFCRLDRRLRGKIGIVIVRDRSTDSAETLDNRDDRLFASIKLCTASTFRTHVLALLVSDLAIVVNGGTQRADELQFNDLTTCIA
jgi:hypothetical protein